jgi:hypothetical protein
MLLMTTDELKKVRHLFSLQKLCSLAGLNYRKLYRQVLFKQGCNMQLTPEQSNALKVAAVSELKAAGFTAADFTEGA